MRAEHRKLDRKTSRAAFGDERGAGLDGFHGNAVERAQHFSVAAAEYQDPAGGAQPFDKGSNALRQTGSQSRGHLGEHRLVTVREVRVRSVFRLADRAAHLLTRLERLEPNVETSEKEIVPFG